MKPSLHRLIMLALAVAGPLVATDAFAGGGQFTSLIDWWNSLWTNYQNAGSGRSLPSPGVLGLVAIGLVTGIAAARRRK